MLTWKPVYGHFTSAALILPPLSATSITQSLNLSSSQDVACLLLPGQEGHSGPQMLPVFVRSPIPLHSHYCQEGRLQ